MQKKYPMSRENWILQMYDFGKRGERDFSHTHKKIIPAKKSLIKKTRYGPRLKKLDPKLDVKGYDLPRDDIETLHLKNGKIIRIGSNAIKSNMKMFKKYILPHLNQAFTENEMEGLELYVEYPSHELKRKGKFVGLSSGWLSAKNKKISIIDLAHKKDAPTAVHEFLHAIKYKQNKTLKNVHLDEAATDLETMIRLPPHERKKIICDDGYYNFLKGDKCKARREDAKIISQNCNLRDKAGLTKCIMKNIKKTNIGKIKIPKKYRSEK